MIMMLELIRKLYQWALRLLLVAAVAAPALVQAAAPAGTTSISRGNFLRIPRYQTTGSLALFVNGATGANTNDCLSASTPCATIQGAEDKIPKLVRHPVTVTVAAGNYAGFGVYGHTFEPIDPANGAYINYVGTLANFSPATGTATGTATAGSGGSVTGPTFGTLTDGAQTWTVNNLRGALLVLTGGTGSGQVEAINSNTATVITIAGTFSPAPDATTTYAIQTPSSIVTSSLNQSAYPDVAAGTARGILVQANQQTRDSLSGGTVLFKNMGISGAFTNMTVNNSVVNLKNVVFAATSAASVSLNVTTGGQVNALNSSFTTTTGITINIGATSGGALPKGGGQISDCVLTSTTGPLVDISASGVTLESSGLNPTGAAATAIQTSGGIGGHAAVNLWISGVLVTCSNSTTVGLRPLLSNAVIAPSNVTISSSTITGCGTGIQATGPTFISVGHQAASGVTLVGASTGIGLSATLGGKLYIIGTTTSVTSFTTEVSVDGITTTLAALTALTPPVLSSSYGSYVGR